MSLEEGRLLADAAKRYGRVFQTGTQRLSEEKFVLADELARSGRLGGVHTVRAHTLPFQMRTDWLPEEPQPPREEIDWDRWLGPAPWRPYSSKYVRGCGAWLNFFDFGSGVAGWCSHTIAQCQAAIGALDTSGIHYEYPDNDTADGCTVRYACGVNLVLATGGWRGTCGVRYEGDEGWVSVADGYAAPDVSSPLLLTDRSRLISNYLARSGRTLDHIRDFLDAVRTRRNPVADADLAQRTMATCHAINAAMLLKRNVTWDPSAERFVGDLEADRRLRRAVREPWAA
jgi:predicted dehydrogenase